MCRELDLRCQPVVSISNNVTSITNVKVWHAMWNFYCSLNTTLHIVTQHNIMFRVPILHMVRVDTSQRAGCGSKGQGQVLPVWPLLLVSVWRTRPWLCFTREGLLILHLSFACNTVVLMNVRQFLRKGTSGRFRKQTRSPQQVYC